jgi:[acyl-carrier-protein] S-malonyltransferase
MKPAADALRDALPAVAMATPAIPVINNIDVAQPAEPDAIRDALVRQAYGAVRWVEVVQALGASGAQAVIECGPGKVLSGLVKRIAPETRTGCVCDPASLADVKGILQ